MIQVFISHIEQDRNIAEEIARRLEDAGYAAWHYERDSLPGVSYLAQVGDAIEQAEVIVVIISPKALDSRQMSSEIIRSYECNKPFIPILHNITHVEFQQRQPIWRQAMVASTSIPILHGGIPAIIPRIIAGLKALGLQPNLKSSSEQAAVTTPASESTILHKDSYSASKLKSLKWRSQGNESKIMSKPKPITKPKVINKPKTKAPLRWAAVVVGIVLFLVAGVVGIYFFVSGHPSTPSANMTSLDTTTPLPEAESPPETMPPETMPPETTPPPDISTEPPPPAELSFAAKTYTNERYGFSIQFPADWVERSDLKLTAYHLDAFAAAGLVPGLILYAFEANIPESNDWIIETVKISRNANPQVVSPIKEERLPDGTKAYTYKIKYVSSTGYEISSYVLDAEKNSKRIRVNVWTIDIWFPYDETLFSEIAHTLRFTTEE